MNDNYNVHFRITNGVIDHPPINTNIYSKNIYGEEGELNYVKLNIESLDSNNSYFSNRITRTERDYSTSNSLEGKLMDMLNVFKATYILHINGITNRNINPYTVTLSENNKINGFHYAAKLENKTDFIVVDSNEKNTGYTNVYWPFEYALLQKKIYSEINRKINYSGLTKKEAYADIVKNSYYIMSVGLGRNPILKMDDIEKLFSSYNNFYIDLFVKRKISYDKARKLCQYSFDSFSLGMLLMNLVKEIDSMAEEELKKQLLDLAFKMIDRPDKRLILDMGLERYINILLNNNILSSEVALGLGDELNNHGVSFDYWVESL
jgi:hypothetical protein